MFNSYEFIEAVDWCRLAIDSNELFKAQRTYLQLFGAEQFKFSSSLIREGQSNAEYNSIIEEVSTNSGFRITDLADGRIISGSIVAHLGRVLIKDSSLLVLVTSNLSLVEGYGDRSWAEYQLRSWPWAHNFPLCLVGVDQAAQSIKQRLKIYSIDTKIREIPLSAIYLSVRSQDKNVYHWLIETLVRLRCLDEVPSLRKLPLIVRDPLNAFQLETLRLMGVENKIIITNGESFEVENLFFPSIPAPPILHKSSMNWLRGKLLAGFPKEVAQRRRLYISRSDSNRRVSNEEEIFRFLESQGFEKLIMSQLTPGEQIDAFRAAEIIVLPHGAAGANLVFVPLDCRVIELHSPRWLNSCYMCLCSTLGIGYDWLMGNQMGSDMDYKVDLQKLNQILESF